MLLCINEDNLFISLFDSGLTADHTADDSTRIIYFSKMSLRHLLIQLTSFPTERFQLLLSTLSKEKPSYFSCYKQKTELNRC